MNKPAPTFTDSLGDTHPVDAIAKAKVTAIAPQEPAAGGSYRRNEDGSLTCLQQNDPGQHDGRRRLKPHADQAHNTADNQE
jgi:hypothetical protein